MSDKFDDLYGSDEELSIDELIAETKQQLEQSPELPMDDGDFPAQEELPPVQEPDYAPQQPDYAPQEPEFNPDFGAAFDDYGEYEDEQTPPAPLGD